MSSRPSSLLGLATKYARMRWSGASPAGRTVALVLAGGLAALPVSYGVHAVRSRASSSCCASRSAPRSCCAAAAARMRTAFARAVNPLRAECHALGARERDVPVCRAAAQRASVAAHFAPFVSPSAGFTLMPTLAWNPDRNELGAAWVEANADGVFIVFARVAQTGERIGSPVRVTAPAGENQLDVLPSVAYGGGSYMVAWSHLDGGTERLDVRARVLDGEGRPNAQTLAVSETRMLNFAPRVAYLAAKNGGDAGFGIAWAALNLDGEGDSLRFVRTNDKGAKQGRERMVRDGAMALGSAALAPAADGFAAAWSEFDFRTGQSTAVVLRLGRDGAVQGQPVQVSKTQTLDASAALSYDGRAHTLVWESDMTSAMVLKFARVGPSSIEQAPVRVDPAPALSLEPGIASIADGPSLVVRTMSNGDSDIGVAVSAAARNGTPGAARRLSPSGSEAMMGAVARTRDGFIAAWVDTRRGGVEVLAQRVNASGEPVGNPSPIAR